MAKTAARTRNTFSETTYAFCLTRELLSRRNLSGLLPDFLSTVVEGKKHYDIKLDVPGTPLFLQFKISKEAGKDSNDILRFCGKKELLDPSNMFQFKVRKKQHPGLMRLCLKQRDVFYAAPQFMTTTQLRDNVKKNQITESSVFIRPVHLPRKWETRQGGVFADLDDIHAMDLQLKDRKGHTIRFDSNKAYVFSEPSTMHFISGHELLANLQQPAVRSIGKYINKQFKLCLEDSNWTNAHFRNNSSLITQYRFLQVYFRVEYNVELLIL